MSNLEAGPPGYNPDKFRAETWKSHGHGDVSTRLLEGERAITLSFDYPFEFAQSLHEEGRREQKTFSDTVYDRLAPQVEAIIEQKGKKQKRLLKEVIGLASDVYKARQPYGTNPNSELWVATVQMPEHLETSIEALCVKSRSDFDSMVTGLLARFEQEAIRR